MLNASNLGDNTYGVSDGCRPKKHIVHNSAGK